MHALNIRPVFRSILLTLLFLILGLAFLSPNEKGDTTPPAVVSSETSVVPDKAVHSSTLEAFGRLPLAFVENRGQLDEGAAFSARQGGLNAFFTKDGIALRLVSMKPAPREEEKIQGANVFMTFDGASPDVKIEGCDPLPGRYNYFRGNDPSKWHAEVPAYASIRYCGLYQGVDMVVRDHEGRIEYDLILEPGADVDSIAVRYEGNESLRVDEEGGLILETAAGPLEQPRPFTYAVDQHGTRESVACAYRLLGENRFGFHVPGRDEERTLVIDPGLVYGTFLGGAYDDYGYAITLDATGVVVVMGFTGSSDFPTTPDAYDTSYNDSSDVFVAKLSSGGSSLLYGTFIGGSYEDGGNGIALDVTGAATVTGFTFSSDFPTTPGAYDTSFNGKEDAFVAKLSADGSSLLYGTFLGGKDIDSSRAIAMDTAGAAVVTGATNSSDFPTTPGAYDRRFNGSFYSDTFVVKVSADGSSLLYGTFLGGGKNDWGYAIALDTSGAAVVAGKTLSSDFPTTPGAFDTNFNGYEADAFVAKLSADGSDLSYGTFLGGRDIDASHAIALDASGAVFVTGFTFSSDFPMTLGAFDTSFNGGEIDAFVVKLGMELAADNYTLSEATGGAVPFTLSAGAPNAQRNYLLLGSLSGTEPGTTLPGEGTVLHLNWDAFTNAGISLANTFIFQDFMGSLDSQGLGTATFNLPAGTGLPLGLTFHFAYALQGPPWDFASNTLEITLVP